MNKKELKIEDIDNLNSVIRFLEEHVENLFDLRDKMSKTFTDINNTIQIYQESFLDLRNKIENGQNKEDK